MLFAILEIAVVVLGKSNVTRTAVTGDYTPASHSASRDYWDDNQPHGVMRTVTAFSATGELIGQWHGKIAVKYTGMSSYGSGTRVTLVFYDGEAAVDRVDISEATVIVDED